MATDGEIKTFVQRHQVFSLKSGWIAHVKEVTVYRRCEEQNGPVGIVTSSRAHPKSGRRSRRRCAISI
jgi:hypothetical protein